MGAFTFSIQVTILAIGFLAAGFAFGSNEMVQNITEQKTSGKEKIIEFSTADHRKFEALGRDFSTGPEVTRACLSCHTEAAKQIQKTIHWKWLCNHDHENRLGKAGNILNNFCISLHSNEPKCTACHIGYGWKDKNFDFTSEELVDCLVCHEQTGTYEKVPGGAGHPAKEEKEHHGKTYFPPEWKTVAQSVGRPTRKNCGTCHFNSGDGDGVKHGDLDSSLLMPNRSLDVHMDAAGQNFQCTRCHTTRNHVIAGRCYKEPAGDRNLNLLHNDRINRICCESCHSDTPHKSKAKLNDHTDKVACQTCHIPYLAREKPTVVRWDWSAAGRKGPDGKLIKIIGPFGKPSYMTQKGEQKWAMNVRPKYQWYKGSMHNTVLTDRIDPETPVKLNFPEGEYGDAQSRLSPFKIHRGRQPYDSINNNMVAAKLFGPEGSGAFWQEYDWGKSITAAMSYAEIPYSGRFGFVETEYHLSISHMVAPKEQALTCDQCHSQNGRMAGISGFYMPGRDRSRSIDLAGAFLVACSLLGVGVHGTLFLTSRWRKGGSYAYE